MGWIAMHHTVITTFWIWQHWSSKLVSNSLRKSSSCCWSRICCGNRISLSRDFLAPFWNTTPAGTTSATSIAELPSKSSISSPPSMSSQLQFEQWRGTMQSWSLNSQFGESSFNPQTLEIYSTLSGMIGNV